MIGKMLHSISSRNKVMRASCTRTAPPVSPGHHLALARASGAGWADLVIEGQKLVGDVGVRHRTDPLARVLPAVEHDAHLVGCTCHTSLVPMLNVMQWCEAARTLVAGGSDDDAVDGTAFDGLADRLDTPQPPNVKRNAHDTARTHECVCV